MKHRKLFSILAAAALVVTLSVPAFAAEYKGPADACAGVTGQLAETIQSERQGGKTYGQIASDYGKLPEFKAAMLEIKEDVLNEMVGAGRIAREQADKVLEAVKERQAVCDGSGSGGQGLGLGLGQGQGNGQRLGNGQGSGGGQGLGNGQGAGNGQGLGNGLGMGNGQGLGNGQGAGNGRGSGNGQGRGNGMRLRDGSCS